ncbi:uncharacterized protein LOC127446257 [Myxocyprinus asiaticus]|uniref:uncharacterized protein LOC127446257 n=1 Tax=Myxocyprinus asiaticus TaxID=70543 RepID=UPI002222BF5F|nr:uncharacterized protein LOC127446257 [Myxocyprinus asiaticus]
MANRNQPANDDVFHVRINERRKIEFSHERHISIEDLSVKLPKNDSLLCELHKLGKKDIKILQYLSKKDIKYPTPVEFHISELTHVTNNENREKILESEGFKAHGDEYKFSWWSLKIDEKSITEAEERYLEMKFKNRTQEQIDRQESFLSKFTTSPAFHIKKSRYGNFRFTFPLTELMETYKNQMCGGQDPVLREYKTMFYSQEIMYVVLVHSPVDNAKFEKFPVIESNPFVEYRNDTIIWGAQAISDNLAFQLQLNKEKKLAEIEPVSGHIYYVWDHVSLAFHFNEVLQFSKERLTKSLTPCEQDNINLSGSNPLTFEEAKKICDDL